MKNWRSSIFTCLVFVVIALLVLIGAASGLFGSATQTTTSVTTTPTPIDRATQIGPGYVLFTLLLIAVFVFLVVVHVRRKE
jgi:uncharacterized BrkB/YihY/UPF0761 family membrane protein